MKKFLISGLIAASFLTPAAQAAPTAPAVDQADTGWDDSASTNYDRGDDRRGDGRRGEGRRGGRGGWSGQGSPDNGNGGNRDNGQWQQPRDDRSDDDGRRWRDRGNDDGRENESGWRKRQQPAPQPAPEGRRRWEGNSQPDSDWRRGDDRRDWGRRDDDDRRYGEGGGYRGRDDNRSWDRSWHNDGRYDWRGHRNRYRDNYRPGRYYSPNRYDRYRRFNIGLHIGSPFYSSRYWIVDPWQYRLPEAYGPYRWVRYYDDVLLIDVRNGYVVDVIYDFFW